MVGSKEGRFSLYRGEAVSVKVMAYVWEHSRQSGSHLLTLLAIADWCRDDGTYAYPTIPMLAAKARLSIRQIQRIIVEIERAGELLIKRGHGRGNANEYTIPMTSQTPHPQETEVHSPGNRVYPPENRLYPPENRLYPPKNGVYPPENGVSEIEENVAPETMDDDTQAMVSVDIKDDNMSPFMEEGPIPVDIKDDTHDVTPVTLPIKGDIQDAEKVTFPAEKVTSHVLPTVNIQPSVLQPLVKENKKKKVEAPQQPLDETVWPEVAQVVLDETIWPEWYSMAHGVPGWKATFVEAEKWRLEKNITEKLATEKVYALRDWFTDNHRKKGRDPYRTWQNWCRRDRDPPIKTGAGVIPTSEERRKAWNPQDDTISR